MSSNVCERCHRGLKDPVSVKAGMGPVCRSKAWRGDNDMAHNDMAHNDMAHNDSTVAELPFDPESMDIVCQRVEYATGLDGRPLTKPIFNITQTVVHHSPTGFEFGYGGSGPSDFALNILNLFVPPGTDGCLPESCYQGQCSRTAWNLHQEFKSRFIGRLPREGGVIRGADIRAFIAEHDAEIKEIAAQEAEFRSMEETDE